MAPEKWAILKRKRSSSNQTFSGAMFVSRGGNSYPNLSKHQTKIHSLHWELSLDRRPSETKGSISRKKTMPNPLFIGPIPQKGMACGKKACSALSCSTKADTVIQKEAQKSHSVLWKMPSNIESRKTYTYANTCVEWARAKRTECAKNRQVYIKKTQHAQQHEVGHMFWIHMLNLSLPILSKQYVSLDIWCFISSLCVCALWIFPKLSSAIFDPRCQ